MEGVRRVSGFGTAETDPETGLEYHVESSSQRIPTAVPAIRYHPLEEVKNKLDNNYVPCYNNYKMVKKGQTWELEVTPINRIPADLDFGWRELCEMTRNTVHDAIIPSAGKYFKHGNVLPDLHIKLVNSTPKVMGFKPQERNKGVFDRTNFQILYNQASKAVDFGTNHFVYPSMDPTFALVGCNHDFEKTIWTKEWDARQNAKGQDLINMASQLEMIISKNLETVKIVYRATSKWTHSVELIMAFTDEFDFMN